MARVGSLRSQTELSRRLNVASAMIVAFETNHRKLYPRTVRDLRVALESADVTVLNGGACLDKDH